jgi:hypothetical protein
LFRFKPLHTSAEAPSDCLHAKLFYIARWKYPWVVPLGITSRNEKKTKNTQIIFLGLLL